MALFVYLLATAKRDSAAENEAIRARAQEATTGDEADAQAFTNYWVELTEHFPYLPTPEIKDTSAESIKEAIRDVLFSVPSLGMFRESLPAPALPPEARRRHLYIVGKTGSGKTTYMEHLVARDLEDGHGVGVIGPEGELFRERLLALVPRERRHQVIYFAPGHAKNPLTFNPLYLEKDEDPVRAAEDLFTTFKRALGTDELGPRMQPILQNAFAALVGKQGVTLWDVKRLLEDVEWRERVVEESEPYTREFWLETYPRYPKGADLPIINRLDQFLRPPAMRRALCHPTSSFSIREALAQGQILFIDLFGLSEETRLLFGQMLLSKFQLELMRRELAGRKHRAFHLYADEFQSFAGVAEGTWRELLSRGRKYSLCLTLAHQYPAQLPTALQDEIFGNVNSIVSFALGSKDAQVVRREFLVKDTSGEEERIQAIAAPELLELPTGSAWAKLAGGRAIKLHLPPPLPAVGSAREVEELIRSSWTAYGKKEGEKPPPRPAPEPEEPESFLE